MSVSGFIPPNSHFDLAVSVSCLFGPKDTEPSQLVQCQVLFCATPNFGNLKITSTVLKSKNVAKT